MIIGIILVVAMLYCFYKWNQARVKLEWALKETIYQELTSFYKR